MVDNMRQMKVKKTEEGQKEGRRRGRERERVRITTQKKQSGRKKKKGNKRDKKQRQTRYSTPITSPFCRRGWRALREWLVGGGGLF